MQQNNLLLGSALCSTSLFLGRLFKAVLVLSTCFSAQESAAWSFGWPMNFSSTFSPQEDAEPEPQSVISLPLHKQYVPIVRNGTVVAQKTAYYGEVQLGNPRQTFTVVYDTGSGHLILPSVGCKSETCAKHRRFDRNASTTAVDIEHTGKPIPATAKTRDQVAITFGTGKVVGDFIEDKACLGPSEDFCIDLRVVMANQMSDEPFGLFQFDGVLGLGLKALTLSPEFSFFGQFSAQHPEMQPRFGVYLAHNENGGDSRITFGGFDQTKITSELNWAPVISEELGYWQVKVSSVWIGDQEVTDCSDGECKAIVDTGTSLMGVPKASAAAMHKVLTRAVPEEVKLAAAAQTGDMNSVDCRGIPAPPIRFYMEDGFMLELNAEDYSRPSPFNMTVQSNQSDPSVPPTKKLYCRALLLPIDMKALLGPKVFIWGEPVLRKYYTVYDWGEKKIGFASALQSPLFHNDKAAASQQQHEQRGDAKAGSAETETAAGSASQPTAASSAAEAAPTPPPPLEEQRV